MDEVQMLVVDIAARIYVENFKQHGLADDQFAAECVKVAESLVKSAGGESLSARFANLEMEYAELQRVHAELETTHGRIMSKFAGGADRGK